MITKKEFFNYCSISQIRNSHRLTEGAAGKNFEWIEIKYDEENNLYLILLTTLHQQLIIERSENAHEITASANQYQKWVEEYLSLPVLRRYKYSLGLTPILISSEEVFGSHLEPLRTKEDVYAALKNISNDGIDIEKVLNAKIEISATSMMEICLVIGCQIVPLEGAEGDDARTYLDCMLPYYEKILDEHKKYIIEMEKLRNSLYGEDKDIVDEEKLLEECESIIEELEDNINGTSEYTDKSEASYYTLPRAAQCNYICPYCNPQHPDFLKSTTASYPSEPTETKQIKITRIMENRMIVDSGLESNPSNWTPSYTKEMFYDMCENMLHKDEMKIEFRPLDGMTFDHYEIRLSDNVIYRTLEGIITPEEYRKQSTAYEHLFDMSGLNKLRATYEIWLREYKLEKTQQKLREEIAALEKSI